MLKPPHTHTPLCSSETLASIASAEAAGRSFGEQMSISDVLVYMGMADVDHFSVAFAFVNAWTVLYVSRCCLGTGVGDR